MYWNVIVRIVSWKAAGRGLRIGLRAGLGCNRPPTVVDPCGMTGPMRPGRPSPLGQVFWWHWHCSSQRRRWPSLPSRSGQSPKPPRAQGAARMGVGGISHSEESPFAGNSIIAKLQEPVPRTGDGSSTALDKGED